MSNTEALRAALSALLDRYTGLVNCGDCGNWNPEEEAPVIAARAALAQPAETDAELQHRTGEPHIDGWPLYSGLPPAASGEPPEPFGYVITHNFPEGHAYRYSFYTPKSIGTAYRDTALSITPVFANAQPAPAPAEPVAEVLIDSCADHESRIEAMAYLPAGTMLYRAPQPAPALVPPPEDPWRKLYRRAINEANGLTNYVEDRPELRSAERRITAIEAEARTLAAAPSAPQSHHQR